MDDLSLKNIFIANLNAMGIVALCVLTYTWSIRTTKIGWSHQLVSGFVFGAGAIVSMLDPILIVEGYRADARYLFISLISAFGGALAASIAILLAVTARFMIGGTGTDIGVVFTVLAALLSWYWGVSSRSMNKRPFGSWIILLLAVSFPIAVGFVIGYPNTAYPALMRGIFASISILVFGKLMEAEKRRATRERELNKAAGLDFLTQLPNRRALNEFLLCPPVNENTGRFFLAIDIDHFKDINDKYGHQVGDDVLRALGMQLKSFIKQDNFVARTGGEEFVVIFHASTFDEGRQIAEQLRSKLCLNYEVDGDFFPVTASLGCVFVEGEELDASSALMLADKALYEAKRSGRNQSHFLEGNQQPME